MTKKKTGRLAILSVTVLGLVSSRAQEVPVSGLIVVDYSADGSRVA